MEITSTDAVDRSERDRLRKSSRRPLSLLAVRLRTLLLIVAAFAFGVWAERMRVRRNYCLKVASRYAASERECDEPIRRLETLRETRLRRIARYTSMGNLVQAEEQRSYMAAEAPELGNYKARAGHATKTRREFERAAIDPWFSLPIETNPDIDPSLFY